jgi:hypothetical protein
MYPDEKVLAAVFKHPPNRRPGGHRTAILSLVMDLLALCGDRTELIRLRPLFARWYTRHAEYLGEEYDKREAMTEYLAAVATCPAFNLFTHCWAVAGQRPPPPCADEFSDSPDWQRLVTACKLMAEHSRSTDGVFSLSYRQAARALGMFGPDGQPDQKSGGRVLEALAALGILQRIDRGKPGGGGKDSAAKWRYTGD